MLQTLAIAWPGPFEMILLAGLGLLIFGKRSAGGRPEHRQGHRGVQARAQG
jgi:hypothetical protein